ncbi:hypothetical protein FOL47_000307 [Perkinsus chesapeaki]|uniref:Uncharacterized protein n=1 Tax=Perkinsus chesapeaki TaxID=330153 RepID=A0A7J6MLZ5_PERCH|nr:hypothetical protein FOL47_000307 [Perkinsus chesapeaki]
MGGKSKKFHSKWKLMKPGEYTLESQPIAWSHVSDLTIICDRKDGYEYLERAQFKFKKGDGEVVSTEEIPLIGFRERGAYQTANGNCLKLEMLKTPDRKGLTHSKLYSSYPIDLTHVAFCPMEGDSWQFLTDYRRADQHTIMVRQPGPEEAAIPIRRQELTLGSYKCNSELIGLKDFTMTITGPPEGSHQVAYAFRIDHADPESSKSESTPFMILRREQNTITQPFLRRERAAAGCYCTAIIRQLDPVLANLGNLAGLHTTEQYLSVCPDGENSVILVLNSEKWGTEKMKSVKFTLGGGPVLGADVPQMRRKRPIPHDDVLQPSTPVKQVKLSPGNIMKEGRYVAQKSDGTSSMAVILSPDSSDLLFDFLNGETFSLGLSIIKKEEKWDGCSAVHLPDEPNALFLTRIMESVTDLTTPDDEFRPEKGFYICPDGDNKLAVYFGGLSPDAEHVVKIDFRRHSPGGE